MSSPPQFPLFNPSAPLYPSSLDVGPLDKLDPFSIRREPQSAVDGDAVGPLTSNTALARSGRSFLCQPDDVIEDESEYIVVYTDGACALNGYPGARAGSGVWFGPGLMRKNLAERCPGAQTNNRAELFALVRALETIQDCKTPILVKTDSAYAINCIRTYLPHWRRGGFKSSSGGGFVRNWRLIRYLGALIDYRQLVLGQTVKLCHVFGHRGNDGNEAADRLAKVGSLADQKFEPDWLALAQVLERCIEGLAAHRKQARLHQGHI